MPSTFTPRAFALPANLSGPCNQGQLRTFSRRSWIHYRVSLFPPTRVRCKIVPHWCCARLRCPGVNRRSAGSIAGRLCHPWFKRDAAAFQGRASRSGAGGAHVMW